MYSYEIQKLLEIKNYLIEAEEYLKICKESPQINFIKYEPFSDSFEMSTNDNYIGGLR